MESLWILRPKARSRNDPLTTRCLPCHNWQVAVELALVPPRLDFNPNHFADCLRTLFHERRDASPLLPAKKENPGAQHEHDYSCK